MSCKDGLLALLVVVVWGPNFVVIKVGLHSMSLLVLVGLRFLLVTPPVILFIARPRTPFSLLSGYGLTISFRQSAFLFNAIKFSIPVDLASLVLQAQVFFTVVLDAFTFGGCLQDKQLVRIVLAVFDVLVLTEASLSGQHVGMFGFMLTLATTLSWTCGSIFNRRIIQYTSHPAAISLVVRSTLIPIVPFFLASLSLNGLTRMTRSPVKVGMTTILSLVYLAFVVTIVDYGIWDSLLGRYETWRVAPLSLLIPVVGLASAAVLLDETLIKLQLFSALLIMVGLYINTFDLRLRKVVSVRG